MTPVTKSRIAISYARWSSAKQSEGSTEERQLELARDYAARHGLKLDERSYVDAGLSGYKGRNLQPGAALHSLVEAIKDGKVPRDAVILVESQDRLSRLDPLTALDSFRSILSLGVSVMTLQDNKVWTKASLTGENFGDLVLSLVSAHRSWSESDVKSKRVRAAWEIRRKEAIASKKIITGAAPAWLQRDGDKWKVLQDRAKVVRRIFELHASGMGQQTICKRLNEDKVQTFKNGKGWSVGYIVRLLKRPVVIGTLTFPDGSEVVDYYPAIIDKRLWLATRHSPERPQLPSGPRTFANVFTGLLHCSLCGSALHFRANGLGRGKRKTPPLRLECSARRMGRGCTATSWKYETFESLVLTSIYTALDWKALSPSMKSAVASTITELEEKASAATVELESSRTRKARLIAALEEGGEVKALAARVRELEQRETVLEREAKEASERLEAERARLSSVTADARKLHDVFAQWTVHKSHDVKEREKMSHALRNAVETIHADREQITVAFRQEVMGRKKLVLPVRELLAIREGIDARARKALKIR